MKLFKVSLLSFFVLFSFSLVSQIQAEETQFKVTQISGVNVYQSKVVSQDKNNIDIFFGITNESEAQSGLKYGVKLIKETSGIGQSIADEYISSEPMSLSPYESLEKTVRYIAPQGLKGEYTIFIFVKNDNGLTLGLGSAGKVTLTSSSSTVEILPETCSLYVGDSKIAYELGQGVDIEKTEALKLTCTAMNPSKGSISVTPLYETHYRTMYGDIVETEGGSTDTLIFKAGEKKSFTLTLPKALSSQAYDVKVYLNDKGILSNSAVAHYVLRGPSATIQTFSLDKDGYLAGDTASMKFLWSPSADSFSGSRLGGSTLSSVTLDISIVNKDDKECISPINQVLGSSSNLDLTGRVKIECKNPKATIILKDDAGNILDQKILSFETKSDLNEGSSLNSKSTLLLILGILIVTGLALYFINLKKKQDETITQ